MSYHCTIHRRLFRKEYPALQAYLEWVLCPFFGQTPGTFYVHHMGMHHIDDNLPADLSSTMAYQRDSFVDFMRYYLRFACLIAFELSAYLRRARNTPFLRRLIAGELSYIAMTMLAGYVNFKATLVVFIFPLVFVRLMMMVGNWVQHAFIDPAQPDDPYRSSTNTIDAKFNARVFNAGYHIFHHVRKGTHYTELAPEFAQNMEQYGRKDAVVFDGIDLPGIWFLLVTRQHRKLARHFVQLPGARLRTEDEVVAMLKSRLVAIRNWSPAPELVSGAA
jgi:fatty acid desaturase